MTPAAASAALADESAKPADDKSDLPALQYKSLATVASANRAAPLPSRPTAFPSPPPTHCKRAKALAVAQRFVQAAPAATAKASLADKARAAHAVLASFQLEQAGSNCELLMAMARFTAATCSLPTPPGARVRQGRSACGRPGRPSAGRGARTETASSLDSDRLAPQTYSFRVAGTNRSLNQKVVFTGNLLTATNLAFVAAGCDQPEHRGSPGWFQTAPAQPGFLPLLNSRISGKVVIGTGKAVEINALPASP